MKGITLLVCRKCKSDQLIKTVSMFVNNTKHLKIYCKTCRARYYESNALITDDVAVVSSSNKQKKDQIGFDYFLKDLGGD